MFFFPRWGGEYHVFTSHLASLGASPAARVWRSKRAFLHDRSLTVRIQNIYCTYHLIQNSVSQEEVRSVPLFLIAINDLTNCISFPLTRRFFADDFSVSLASSIPKRAAVYFNSPWSAVRWFSFSEYSAKVTHVHPPPPSPLISPEFLNNPPIVHQILRPNLPFQFLLDSSH